MYFQEMLKKNIFNLLNAFINSIKESLSEEYIFTA